MYLHLACCNFSCSIHKGEEERRKSTEGRVYMSGSYIPLARKDEDDQFSEEELRRRLDLQNLDFMVILSCTYVYINLFVSL